MIEGTELQKELAEELDAYMMFYIERHRRFNQFGPSETAEVLSRMANFWTELEKED